MDRDDISWLFVVPAVCACAFLGLVHVFGDYREFSAIATQCEKQGFIQNDKQRIMCSKELK